MAANKLDYRWVSTGTILIIGINQLLQSLLAEWGGSLIADKGTLGVLIYLGVISIGSFFVGGLFIGLVSRAETIREPAIACALAVVFNLGLTYVRADSFNAVGSIIALGLGFGFGLAGGWVGERMQGETTEKMRQRGELGGPRP